MLFRAIVFSFVLGLAVNIACSSAWAAQPTTTKSGLSDNAVILMYHHVAENTPAITSTRPEVFAEHLRYINDNYTVLSLPSVIKALQQKQPLPNNTLVITFDDGFDNILYNAHPLLRQYEFPYTIFVNPQLIGKSPQQLTWDQVSVMAQEGVTFANHTLDHVHLLNRLPQEDDDAWLARVLNNIESAEQQLSSKIGYSLKYLAYPYGEYNLALKKALREKGYVSFTQASGGVASYSDFGALPRFPAAGIYARMETLSTKMASLAMPIIDNSVDNPEVRDLQVNSMTLTLHTEDLRIGQVNCFYRGEMLEITRGADFITAPLPDVFPVGRSRINCTAPSKTQQGRFYWFSQPFFQANDQGKYPD